MASAIDTDTNVTLAQAPSAGEPPIGTVETISGTAVAIRADGTRVELEPGSPVYQGDTLETSDDGAIGVTLADETTFSMAENGSMVLDEMVYDPGTEEGSVSLSVLEGVFTFVSGQVAKTDPEAMSLNTPVATIGIRGTQAGVDLAGEKLNVVLMEEKDGFVGEVVVSNAAGVQVLNSAYEGTSVAGATGSPSAVFTVARSQLLSTFGNSLRGLPGQGGSANNYGTDKASVEELLEEALAEEALAREEMAEDEVPEESLSEEALPEDEAGNDELAEFKTDAGEAQEENGPLKDWIKVVDGDYTISEREATGFDLAGPRPVDAVGGDVERIAAENERNDTPVAENTALIEEIAAVEEIAADTAPVDTTPVDSDEPADEAPADTAPVDSDEPADDHSADTPPAETDADDDSALEIAGTLANDKLRGTNDDDVIDALAGNDKLYGDKGDDVLFGGAGNDKLYGGKGDDVLFGGAGRDKLYGGEGDDTYVFDADAGMDTVKDFLDGDALRFEGDIFSLDGISIEQKGNDAIVSFAGDSNVQVRLNNVEAENLQGYSVTEGGQNAIVVTSDSLD